jgi:hypothetical protein
MAGAKCRCVPSAARRTIEHMFAENGDATAREEVEGQAAESGLSLERLADEIGELAAHIAAATCCWLSLVAEFDRREGYLEYGMHASWVWLAWRCALTPRAAQEHVRVARALERLPQIRLAFARGELTYSKVRALTRVAHDGNEELLLSHARYATAAQLERICRAYRGVTVREAGRARELRHLSYSWDPDDGSLRFHGRLSGEEGTLLLAALEAGFDSLRGRDADSDESSPGRPSEADALSGRPSNADALVAVCEAALASGDASSSGADRHQLVVHVDAEILAAERGSDGNATIEHGPAICAETARRLGCDASVVVSVEREGRSLRLGRKTRTIPPALRRAVHLRDQSCRFPGCENRRFTDLHHIVPWARGGESSVANLVRLCRRHHTLLHEGGFTIEARSAERFLFRRPDGRLIPECAPLGRGRAGELGRRNRRAGLGIGPERCHSLGRGERFDLDITIEGLCRTGPARGPRGP